MSEEKKCPRCGSTNIMPGSFQSTGLVYFRPKDAKLLTIHTSGVPVTAETCVDCGHVELVVNTEKVKSLVK